jgi:predicted GIY-YIG superfamily endonuclease
MAGNNLKEKQEIFCQHYAVSHNAAQSAREAGYSQKSAYNQGYRLLKISEVMNRIKNIEDKNKNKSINFSIVDEYIYQYEACKRNGHSNSALKALEKIEKFKTTESERIKFLIENNKLYEQQIIDLQKENVDLKSTKGLDIKKGWLYIISREGLIKIGKTTNLKNRIQSHKAQSVGLLFKFLNAYVVDDFHNMERELIKIFNNTGTSITKESEWYQLEETKALNLFEESIKIIHTKNVNNILGELNGIINGK